MKKEKTEYVGPNMGGFGQVADGRMNMYGNAPIPIRHPGDFQEQRFPATPRLQVRPELRGVIGMEDRMGQIPNRPEFPPNVMREGTLSVAGSPQPFKPVSEEPSIITRMPHMLNQQYRGPMMYPGGAGYGPRPPPGVGMYQYAPRGYYGPPPGYPPRGPAASPGPPPGGTHVPSRPGLPPTAMPYRPPPGYGPRPGPSFSGAPSPRPTMSPMPPTSSPLPLGPSGAPQPCPIRSMTPPATVASPPVKIKAEVKTEPEYRSPGVSPSASPAPPCSPGAAPREEPPRHPKIKVTENKDRRPRYPLGPYAPQYGPYGPYAPGPPPAERPPGQEQFPRAPHQPPLRYLPPELRSPSPRTRLPAPAYERGVSGGTPPPPPSPLDGAAPPYLAAQLRPPFGGMLPPRVPSPFGGGRFPEPPRPSGPGVTAFRASASPLPPPPRLERVPSPARLETLGGAAGADEAPLAVRRLAVPPPGESLGLGIGLEAHAVKVEAPEPRPTDAEEGEGPPEEGGGVFGGLVSYFSSQQEDDLDASM